jgi:tetratricopeptide (TPR) repeat protein
MIFTIPYLSYRSYVSYRCYVSCFFAAILLSSALPARAQSTQPATQTLTWSAHDIHDKGLAIPADRTAVVVFLRPGQPQSTEAMALIAPILKDRKDIQVIGVVSGDDAATAAALLEKSGWSYPVVADTSYDTSGQFSVRVWPSIVTLNTRGTVVAHLPGLPVSLANDLAAYLDFAAGKLDQAGLDKALANREVIADSEDQKAARYAEVAARLAQQGLTSQAAAEVAKAIELKPTSPKLIAGLAHTELMLGDIKAADALLAKVFPGDIPPNELNLLKGWSALQNNRWADARQLLLEATKLNPDPAEAFYLLGKIYDHDNDPKSAAEAYRKAFEHTPQGKALSGG